MGVAERADHKVDQFSLGMRQRLGLAAVLLKDPAVLILDEPANGLDPAGIREIRVLLRRLGAEGRTVFVSSHLLAEVEQICDRVAIIDGGRLVLSGRGPTTSSPLRPGLRCSSGWTTASPGGGLRGAGLDVDDIDGLLRVGAAPRGSTHHQAARRRRSVRQRVAAGRRLVGGAVPQHHQSGDRGGRSMTGMFPRMVGVEMRRALHRRLVRWMLALWHSRRARSRARSPTASSRVAQLARSTDHPAHMATWWTAGGGGGDALLLVAAVFLAVGVVICGASVAGAEWRAGTVTTMLTWEPSRLRLHAARTLSAGLLAFVIGIALQIAFLASVVPAALLHGTTDGPTRPGGSVWAQRWHASLS